MAKIALVTKHLNATSCQLALALREQQHEVIILTSYGEVAPSADIQVWAYFKKWSAVEAIRLLPRLLLQQIQIIHLILHDDRLNTGQAFLSAFAKSNPNCVLTTTLLHIKKGFRRTNPVRYLVEESDIVTCPTTETLGLLRGLNIRSARQGRGILPPVLNLKESLCFHDTATELKDSLPDSLYIDEALVVPLRESYFDEKNPFFQRLLQLRQRHPLLLWGSQEDWTLRDRKQFMTWMEKNKIPLQWAVTGNLTANQTQLLFQNSQGLFLAGMPLTPHELTDYYLKAIHNGLQVIIDDRQARLHADLWKNGINCWILRLDHYDQDLRQWLSKTRFDLPERLSENLMRNRHLMDSSLNELNRLYNRALIQLR